MNMARARRRWAKWERWEIQVRKVTGDRADSTSGYRDFNQERFHEYLIRLRRYVSPTVINVPRINRKSRLSVRWRTVTYMTIE